MSVLDRIGLQYATSNATILVPGTVIDPGTMAGGLATVGAGTYTITAAKPPMYFFVKATGSVTITGGATLASGEIAMLIADSDSTWAAHVYAASGDDFLAQLNANLPASLDTAVFSNAVASVEGLVPSTVIGAMYGHILHITNGWSTGAPLSTFRIVDTSGDVGTSASPGILASNTAPILRGEATTEALAVHWVANGVELVATTIDLPPNLNDAADMYVDLVVQSNNTNNAPTFDILHNFDGGAQVTDTATGTSVSTIQTITATITANHVLDGSVFSMQILPSAHASDTWTLFGARIRGKQVLQG